MLSEDPALNILTKVIGPTGHLGTSVLDTVKASGDISSTFAGVNLRGQGMSLRKESPDLRIKTSVSKV
jgi:hypothetical protein